MVFKKILVALDRSPQAQAVFEKALALAQCQESQLMVFHCLHWDTEKEVSPFLGIGTLGDVDVYGTYHKLRHDSLQKDIEQIRSWLETYCQQAATKGISAELDCRVGTPGSLICDRAQDWGADVIVLGRRGYKGLSEIVLGSVSNYAIHHAPCSVLVVQGESSPEVEAQP